MHKKIIKYLFLFFFSAMTLAMLFSSERALSLALEGLNLWFLKMIPALLPFMILSGLLIGLGLSDSFASLFSPILRPLFRLSDSCLYCIIIGFLCGFPMGARVCAQSLQRGKLSYREATLLLAFCNNIGPVYFTGYVLRLFPLEKNGTAIFGMYGIPLLYGLILRYTLFRAIPAGGDQAAGGRSEQRGRFAAASGPQGGNQGHLPFTAIRPQSVCPEDLSAERIFGQLNAAILSALDSITVLGGYMIFCNLLNLLPAILSGGSLQLTGLLGPLFEITSGLARLDPSRRRFAFTILPLGGLSCIAQTDSCIRGTGLSLKEYVFHKTVQTMLTAAYYSMVSLH